MFLKIRIRTALLHCWAPTRFKNFSHPLSHYIYYDALNNWMPVLKEMKNQGGTIDEITGTFITRVMEGICPNKFYNAAMNSENEPYKLNDLVDQNILNHINTLVEDDDEKNIMLGCAMEIKYGR